MPHSSSPTPLRLAVTGGIGSGKSFVCRRLEDRGIPIFYCDDVAKQLLRTDTEVQRALSELVGPRLFEGGWLHKELLRDYLHQGSEAADRVNAIVHPRVAAAFRQWCDSQAAAGHRLLCMECALLFESGFDRLVDRTVLVTAPLEVRLSRVMARDGVGREVARSWMRLQMAEEEKARRADIILDNTDSPDLRVIHSLLQMRQ